MSDGWELDDDELSLLTPDERAEYDRLLAEVRRFGPKWTLAQVPKANRMHLLAGKVDWVLGGGSVGGGKSEAMAYHALDLAKTIPGSQSLILRSSLPELRRSFIIRTMVRFAQTGDDKRAKLAQRDNVRGWWFDNGSIIEFGFLSREEHAGQFLSAEYDFQGFDESTQLPSKAITMVTGRLRTTVAKAELGSRPHAMFCSNPGDISHEWHKEVFIDPTEYGRNVVVFDIYDGFMDDDGRVDWDKAKIVEVVPAPQTVEEVEAFTLDTDPSRHLSVAFIPFSAIDNPYLDASVMRGLNALPEMERRQKRDGDWDAFTGRYFPEFGTVHIVEPFDVPMSWDHGIGIDHGYTAPFAAVFGAWDNDGNCYIYDEVYQTKLTPPQQAREVLSRLERIDKSGKPVRQRVRTPVADPSVFNEKGEGMSVAQQWAAAGLHTIPANNSRIDGWMNVREYLRVPVTEDGVGKPKLFIFSTCHNLIREFRNARQDPRRPDDVDTTGSDHAADGCRYLLATRPRRWRRKGSTVDWSKSTLERLEAAHLDRLAKRRTRL